VKGIILKYEFLVQVSKMFLGKNRGKLLIAPERKKQLGQSGNDSCGCVCYGK